MLWKPIFGWFVGTCLAVLVLFIVGFDVMSDVILVCLGFVGGGLGIVSGLKWAELTE